MTEVTLDLRKVDPSARIQVRRAGELMLPAQCTVCGFGGVERDYVDFGIWFEYEGQVYICTLCMEEAGHALQMATSQEWEHLKGMYHRLDEKLKAQEAELNVLRELRDNISRLNLLSDLSGVIAGTDEVDGPERTDGSDADDAVNEPSGNGTEPSPVLTESGKVSGPDDTARVTGSNGDGTTPEFNA